MLVLIIVLILVLVMVNGIVLDQLLWLLQMQMHLLVRALGLTVVFALLLILFMILI